MIIGVWDVENLAMESTFATTKMLIMDRIRIMIMQGVSNTKFRSEQIILLAFIYCYFLYSVLVVAMIFFTIDVNDNHSEQNQQEKWNGREILQYCNHNLSDVVTPVKADLLALMLQESNYDQREIEFPHNGFMKSFDICYEGPRDRQSTLENIPLTVGDEVDL